MIQAQTTSDTRGAEPYPTAPRAWGMVAILMLANIFSFADRQVVSLLIDPIKHDIHVSDLGVSLLIGPTFAIFFSAMALPIGRWVDSAHRVRLAAAGVALWSLMTLLSGFASNFTELLAARIGVAVGEAVLFPTANSLIFDSFSPERRTRPIGAYATSIYLGSGLAFVFGGAVIALAGHHGAFDTPVLGHRSTWQIVLISVGAPGLLIALLLLSIKEPTRHDLLLSRSGARTLPLNEALAYARRRLGLFLSFSFSFSMFVLASYALSAWVPTQLTRTLGMARSQAGLWYGGAVMVAGLLGISGATYLADRMSGAGFSDSKYRVGAGLGVLGAVLAIASAFATTPAIYILLIAGVVMTISAGVGLGPAALQQITPNELRGQSLSAYQLIATLLGATIGPPAVALLTEHAFHNPKAVGMSMAIVASCALAASAIGFLFGARAFRREVEARLLAQSRAAV